jgi:hypothetical protein
VVNPPAQAAEPRRRLQSYPFNKEERPLHERPHIDRGRLAAISAAVAIACIVVLTLQIRDRWHPPEIKSADQAEHATTGKVAHAAGATITPTDPKLVVEPSPAGPKQAQPANPE